METDVLSRHHVELDERIVNLLLHADGGDCHDLAEEWNGFEAALAQHFELEEHEVLPLFARENPEEVARLRQEHGALRRDLLALGIRADLHLLRAEAVRDFVRDLRAHVQREDEILYRWAATGLAPGTWSKIAAFLNHAVHAAKRTIDDLGSRTL
ncbi:MAG TPA: hemerythrin domain-containing protein [Polyangia bacterium]|jgi:hemerythrin-like domain-containing protein|nr:hemerythrin domain-containing protein [Polyangia bacterium]